MGKKQSIDLAQRGAPIGKKDTETGKKLDTLEDQEAFSGVMASTQPLNEAQAKLLNTMAGQSSNNGNAKNRTTTSPIGTKSKNDATGGGRDSSMTRDGAGSKQGGSSSMAVGAKNATAERASVSFKRPAPPSKISTGSNALAGR